MKCTVIPLPARPIRASAAPSRRLLRAHSRAACRRSGARRAATSRVLLEPTSTSVSMSQSRPGSASCRLDDAHALALPAEIAREHHRRVARPVRQQDVARRGKLRAPALRDRVVEGDDEIGFGRRAQPALDRPATASAGRTARWRRNRGRRRAGARRRRLQRRDAGHDVDREPVPRPAGSRGPATRRPAPPARRCRRSPEETSATERPSAARSSADAHARFLLRQRRRVQALAWR